MGLICLFFGIYVLSIGAGMILDLGFNHKNRSTYWVIGFIGGFLMGLVIAYSMIK